MRASFGFSSGPTLALLGTVVTLGLAVWVLRAPGHAGPAGDAAGGELRVFCAAGIRLPFEELIGEYEERYGVVVVAQYGGSGTLLANLLVVDTGDLYIAGDDSFVERAREAGAVAESLSLASMRAVIGVRAGNPHGIRSLEDLVRGAAQGLRVGLANPEAAAVGRIARRHLIEAGLWEKLEPLVKVMKPTVGELAGDLVLGTLDAALIWDATAAQYGGIEAVHVPALDADPRAVTVGVLTASERPTAALRLARFLASRDVGGPVFEAEGYRPATGDLWAERPVVDLMCGAMLNAAVDETITAFAQREGVEVRRNYNGCGLLVAQMKTGADPDAYFSCDVSFLDLVRPRFEDESVVSHNPMVILVQAGNPRGIAGLEDLALPDLRVGLADEVKSALGALTRRLLRDAGLEQALLDSGNLKVETPTGDLLVNQLRTGSLDAVVVYASNAARALDEVTLVPIELEGAEAAQPWAVGRSSDHKQLLGRLYDALTTAESMQRFQDLGFLWQLEDVH